MRLAAIEVYLINLFFSLSLLVLSGNQDSISEAAPLVDDLGERV
jgi:hypothetical protein